MFSIVNIRCLSPYLPVTTAKKAPNDDCLYYLICYNHKVSVCLFRYVLLDLLGKKIVDVINGAVWRDGSSTRLKRLNILKKNT